MSKGCFYCGYLKEDQHGAYCVRPGAVPVFVTREPISPNSPKPRWCKTPSVPVQTVLPPHREKNEQYSDEGFTVITPTGNRPVPFSICCELMEKQTLKPTAWIIMDDGDEPIEDIPDCPFAQYHRRIKKKSDPSHTLTVQMREILKLVKTDKVIVMEDDDWYHPEYFERTIPLLNRWDLVGITYNQYYFLRERQYFVHQNKAHSSFCSTAFSMALAKEIESLTHGGNPYIDLNLWRMVKQRKYLYLPDDVLVLGMKQLPGRVGVTYDSNRSCLRAGCKSDPALAYLKKVTGDDIQFYKDIFQCMPQS